MLSLFSFYLYLLPPSLYGLSTVLHDFFLLAPSFLLTHGCHQGFLSVIATVVVESKYWYLYLYRKACFSYCFAYVCKDACLAVVFDLFAA